MKDSRAFLPITAVMGVAALFGLVFSESPPVRVLGAIGIVLATGLVARKTFGAKWRDLEKSEAETQEHEDLGRLSVKLAQLEAGAGLREQILSTMSEGLVLLDPEGRPVYANPAAEALLGRGANLPREVIDGGTAEFSTRLPQPRQLRAASSRMEGGSKLIVVQDVTESRRGDQVRREFVANVSHELKTPVAGILASAETLEVSAREDPESVGKFVDSLVREARRLSELVDDLLDLARLEQEAPAMDQIDLSSIVGAEVTRVEEFAESKSLKLKAYVEPAILVRGSAEDLTLAVSNLILNALRYTERGGVTISLTEQAERVIFIVEDTGVGIPKKDLPRIFERFYRVDRARSRETGGTGLGLSIVRHVAERYGGDLRATSELGQGSKFTLELPSSAGDGARESI